MAINVWIPSRVVEKILDRENIFTDYKFIVQCWEDEFIVELLRWYDYKVSNIRKNKRCCGFWDEEKWTQYYEQMFRMLYYAVITRKLRKPNSLKNLFRYFFEVEDEDPYRYDPDLISAEKLLMVYFYIIKKIGKLSYKEDYVNSGIYPLVGHWDTEQMKDLYEHVRSHPFPEEKNMECCFRYKEDKKKEMKDVKKEKAEQVTDEEAMKRECKLLEEILDRIKKRVENHLKESSKK